jgi:hypothetical protein
VKIKWLSLHIFIHILCCENVIIIILSTLRFMPLPDSGMNLNVDKTTIISFTCKVKSVTVRYKLGLTHVAHSVCVKDLGVFLDS